MLKRVRVACCDSTLLLSECWRLLLQRGQTELLHEGHERLMPVCQKLTKLDLDLCHRTQAVA